MNFSIPPAYNELREKILDFARTQIAPTVQVRDAAGTFSRELWESCAAFGIQELACSPQFGSRYGEVDILRALFAMEALGYASGDAGLMLGLNAQMWTVQMPILDFGTDAQKTKFLSPSAAGKWIGAHALTEPETGSDVYNMTTTAVQTDGGYLINGVKHLITLGPIADYVLLFAMTNVKVGKWGISAFLVEAGTPGFKQLPNQSKMGLRTVPIGRLEFDNCLVPSENLLGKEGAGFAICNHSLEYDRCCMLAGNLGAMERQLAQSIKVVKERKQFGQSIGKFQSVSNRIADMKLRLETCRLLLYKVAWMKQNGQSALLESAMLKLHLGESFVASSLDAVRNHGGRGYLTEYGTERDLRDSVGGILYAGTSDIQRNIIAQLLGL